MATRTEHLDATALIGWLREAADALGMDDSTYNQLIQRIADRVDDQGYVEARVVRANYARATVTPFRT